MASESKHTPSANNSKLCPKPALDQYVFTERLGSGTYATVYKAYSKTGVREVVAIKCVLKSSLNKASTENLLTEIKLLKNLKQEHIVALKDFLWDVNYIYLIMEYCSGGDMSRFLRSRRALPEHIVKRFLQQIASAMKYLWDNNVAHMDLKPQNILLTSVTSPQIKLADFGFAKHLYDGDNLHVMRGSPLYMAPEIICSGSYDNRVDLWSIGVILFECVFGRPPFASSSFKELGAKIWDQKPVEIPHGFSISDNARDLILRLLQRDPAQRITFEEFFAHPFVDMEHIPSKESFPNAIETVSRAVKKDKEGDYKTAIRLYCEALDFFMPAIHYEKSTHKKESMRTKVREYMKRAEELKKLMKPHSEAEKSTAATTSEPQESCSHSPSTSKTKSSPKSTVESPPKSSLPGSPVSKSNDEMVEELKTLSGDHQELLAVLKLVDAAMMEEREENYDACLHHYKLALGTLLKLLPNESKGKRKDLLTSQVTKWMDKAEQISSYLDVRNLSTKDTSAEEEESESHYLSQSKQCSIQ